MVETISTSMRKELVNCLLSKNYPLSIILDGSSDPNGQHYIIVYFQAIEDYRPVTYFYKLIPTTTDESADGFYRILRGAFHDEEKDLYRHLQKNMAGYGSDGAAVMLGKDNGLAVVLEREMIKRPLYKIHCMAHRLHMLIKNNLLSQIWKKF